MTAPENLQRYDGAEAGMVRYGDGLAGYLALPAGNGTHPGVILIQEWWGIDQHVQEITRRLAAEGFVVLAPDLYHGQVADAAQEAMKLAGRLDRDQAVAEIGEAIRYLQDRDDVAPKKVGVVGFCLGGRYAWWTAMQEDGAIGALAPFYAGHFQPSPGELERVTAPTLIVWGSQDGSTPQEERDHIVEIMRREGKTYKALVYPADHAFMNDRRPAYNQDAAKRAYAELVAWFKEYLG